MRGGRVARLVVAVGAAAMAMSVATVGNAAPTTTPLGAGTATGAVGETGPVLLRAMRTGATPVHGAAGAVSRHGDPAEIAALGPLPPLPTPPLPSPEPVVPGLLDLRSLAEKAQARLNTHWRDAPDEVSSWGLDVAGLSLTAPRLVVEVHGHDTEATEAFLREAGVDPKTVVMRTGAPEYDTFANLVDGQKIQTGGGYCSIGFNARNPSNERIVITAGHCTAELSGTWSGYNGVTIGTARAKNYPGDDYGTIVVSNTSAWTSTPQVQGGPVVHGSAVAPVGAQVCRSGATSGYHCGTIQATNQTVNYGGGDVVMGLTRTDACAEPGDSGGAYITPAGQAQGMTSGGSGNCSSGGTTFYQPVGEVMQRYGLTLFTG